MVKQSYQKSSGYVTYEVHQIMQHPLMYANTCMRLHKHKIKRKMPGY